VYGYNLNGDYTNSMPVYNLTSPAIDCSQLTAVEVRFWRWLGVEQATYDHARFQVSNDGTTWATVWENPTGSGLSIDDASWSQHAYDISSYADGRPTVYLRWGMGTTDTSVTYQGWNVDDIEIWGIEPPMAGDCDADGDVDIADYLDMMACASGPVQFVSPGCECFDLQNDNHVDMYDFRQFELLMTD
jgi:hypothetical protein